MPDRYPLSVDAGLVVALTAAALEKAAPEELMVLEETAQEYFADPAGVLNPRRRDEAVGFGVEAGLLAPYVLAVATPVVMFLLETVAGAAQDVAKEALVQRVRSLLRLGGDASQPSPTLTVEQVQRVRGIAYDHARRLGLPEEQSVLLADSVAGGVAGPP
jgi:hypothetical protein